MRKSFQITLSFCIVVFGCHVYGASYESPKEAIIGHWVFNKQETVLSFKNSGMSEDEVNEFSRILQPQEIVISENLYSVHKPAKKLRQTAYSVISESDGCVLLQLKDSRIPLDIQKATLCINDEKLLLPALKGAFEVYDRKL